MGAVSLVYHNNTHQTVSPWSRKSNTSTCLWSQDSFSQSLLMTMLPFSLLEGDDSFCTIHPFSGFRFCVINHVSAPKLLPLISVTCPMDTRKALTVPYNELCHHLWDSLAPSECLALWQCQQLNVSVCHTSSVMDMLGAQVNICPATVESHAPYLPDFMVLHILHTPSPNGSGFSLVQHI